MHWARYQQKFSQQWVPGNICFIEKLLFASLIVMACVFSVDAFVGHDIGDVDEIRMAKLKAQEELMAVVQPAK